MSLFEVISDFSLPTSIGHLTTPLQHPTRQGTLAQMVLWMLQHHLLMQLHTYVQFMPTDHGECQPLDERDETATGNSATNSVSEGNTIPEEEVSIPANGEEADELSTAVSAMSLSSQPMAVPNTSRRSVTDDHFSENTDLTSASDDTTAAANPPSSGSHKSIYR